MFTIAVTGGVACGKSSFAKGFVKAAPTGRAVGLSCDEEVRQIAQRPEVEAQLSELARSFGLTPDPGGELSRRAFRELLFENSEFRGKVEGLLHPLVLQRVKDRAAALPGEVRIFLVEVPLLYEVDFPMDRDLDAVVAASEAEQMRRLLEVRGLTATTARRILRSQLPIENKIQRADIVIWNDGCRNVLDIQIDHFLSRCEPLLTL